MSRMFKVQETPRVKFIIKKSKIKGEKKTEIGNNLKVLL